LIYFFFLFKKNVNLSARDGWDVHFRHKALMEEINECISHMDSLEYASAALYFVVNRILPPGLFRRLGVSFEEFLPNGAK
jgi:hypothetical protein